MAPRETENNAYSNFWGVKQRALWYVMVFYGVFLTWQIDPDNSNPRLDELFFVSLQS